MAELIELDFDPFAEDEEEKPSGVLPEPEELEVAPKPEKGPAETEAPTAEDANTVDLPSTPPVTTKDKIVLPSADRFKLPEVTSEDELAKPSKKELVELDYDPFAPAEVAEPKKEADSYFDPKDYDLLRGGAEGLETLKGGKEFLTVLDLTFGNQSDEEKLKTILSQEPVEAPTGWERREPSIAGVGSLDEFVTWFQESAGSAVTSTMPGVIGGMLGAAGGTAIAPGVGTAIGAAGGAMLPSMALGLSGMYNDLRQNEGVRKALQDGTLTLDQFRKLVYVGGIITGGLDAVPASKFGKGLIGPVKDAVRDTFIKAAIKGSFEEGATEGLQQTVSEYTQSQGGGNTTLGQAAMNVLEASLQGMVGGAIFGGATRPKEKQEEEAVPDTEQPAKPDDQPDVSTEVVPEGTPAAATEDPGQSTPSGTEPAPQPAGTEKQPESPGPATSVPGTDVRTDVKPPQPAPVVKPTPGVTVTTRERPVDPAVGAALGMPPEEPGFDISEEVSEGEDVTDVTRQHRETLRGMFPEQGAKLRAERAAAQERGARIADVVTGADPAVVAAINQTKAQPETLGTGIALTRPNVPGQPAPAPEPAAAAGTPEEALRQRLTPEEQGKLDTLRGTEDVAAFTPEAAPTPTPEPLGDLAAQINAIRDPSSDKDSALITPDSPREGLDFAGLETVETPHGLFVTSNPDKAAVLRSGAVSEDQMGELLDYTGPKAASDGTVMQARDQAGNVVHEEATSAAAAPVAAEQAARMAPAGGAVVETDVISAQGRRAALPEKTKAAVVVSKRKSKPKGVKGELLKAKAVAGEYVEGVKKGQEKAAAAKAKSDAALEKMKEGIAALKPKEARTEAKAPEAPSARPEPKPEPAKAAAAKAVSKAKEEPKAKVITREQLLKEEAAAKKTREEAAAKEAKEKAERAAARTPLSKDIHRAAKDLARKHLDEEGQAYTEGDLEEAVATESDIAASEADKTKSPRERIESAVPQVVQRVAKRLSAAEEARSEAELAAYKSEEDIEAEEEEARQKAAREEKKAKAEEQAAAEAGQKKERWGKEKGMSSTGVRALDEKGMKRAAERLPDNKKLARWLELYHERAKLRGDEARAPKTAEMADIQEDLAKDAEADEERAGTRRAKDVEDTLKPVIESLPPMKLPPVGAQAQIQAIKLYMVRFNNEVEKALKGKKLELAGRINSKHYSAAENLAIYTKQIMSTLRGIAEKAGTTEDQDNSAHGVQEFLQAKILYDAGATDEMYGLMRNEATGLGTGGAGAKTAEVTANEDEANPDIVFDAREEDAKEAKEEEADIEADRREARDTNTAFEEIFGKVAGSDKELPGIEVVNPVTGKTVRTRAKTMKAEDILEEVERLAGKEGGFLSILRHHLIKNLQRMVGDVDVHIVPADAMVELGDPKDAQLRPAEGYYYNYSDAQRARGKKPMVFINENTQLDDREYIHTVLHELTHAATSQAIRDNVRNAQFIFNKLRFEFRHQLLKHVSEADLKAAGLSYAFTSDAEFVAEAFSNEQLQKLMAQLPMPPRLQLSLAALTQGRRATWWDAAVAAVSNAVGMLGGKRATTFMEGVMKAFPEVARTSFEQVVEAKTKVMKEQFLYPDSSNTVDQMRGEVEARFQGLRDKIGDWSTASERRLRDKIKTTGQLDRDATEITKDSNNALSRMMRIFQKKDPLKQRFRAMGAEVQQKMMRIKEKQRKAYNELSRVIHEATRFGFDPRVPLSDPANKHIEKGGNRHANKRAEHARQHAAWNALPANVKAAGSELIAHYDKMHELDAKMSITHAVDSALRKYRTKTLPAGETMDSIVEWVRSGEAAREGTDRTARDTALHDALGKTAETLARIPALTRAKGVYVPLQRRGKRYIHGRLKIDVPNGGVMDPSAKEGNRILFSDEAKFKDFLNSTDFLVRPSTMWIDPDTGEKVKNGHLEDWTEKVFVATVQNKFLEMSDSASDLRRRREELRKDGHEVSKLLVSAKLFNEGAKDIMTPEISRLIANLEQTTVGNMTMGQELAKNAILDAQLRLLTSPSHLQRRMKRKGAMGYDMDLVGAQRDYDNHISSHLANMELAPQMADAGNDFRELMKRESKNDYGDGADVEKLQLIANELQSRMDSPWHREAETKFGRMVDVIMDLAYLRHLFSPHYTIIQMLQPMMTTYPVLKGRFNKGAVWRETVKAYRIGGVKATLGRGFQETWKQGLTAIPVIGKSEARITPEEMEGWGTHDKVWHDNVANEKDVEELRDMFSDIRDRGYGASSGIEAVALDEDLSAPEKYVGRLTGVAKSLPEAAEGINRYVTAITAYRLARRDGMNHQDAKNFAVSTVEQTQGGYARANNPTFFQNPAFRFPLQFRKYGLMYGQLYYGNLVKSFAYTGNNDAQTRSIARRQLFRLSVMSAVFAGVGGQAVMEVARIASYAALGMGLTDDDWEEHESAMQGLFSKVAEGLGAGKDVAEMFGEAGMHGLTRLLQVDTSASLGSENLFTFGSPKTYDEDGVKKWMMNMVLGAAGSDIFEVGKDLFNGDISGAIPWPKIIENVKKAVELSTEGTVDKKTGEKYADPISGLETFWQGLGFQPRSRAKQWEKGGGGTASKELKKISRSRSDIMGRWANAESSEKSRIFSEEVREWNRTHKGKDRIEYRDLLASRKQRERRRKEREKQREAD